MDYISDDDDDDTNSDLVSAIGSRFSTSPNSGGGGLRPKKGTIKKIIRNQRTFLDLFNKYRLEVRNLQMTIDNRFKKLSAMEERLLNLGHVLQSDSQLYLFKKQHNRKLQAISNLNQQLNNNGNTYQQQPTESSSIKQENSRGDSDRNGPINNSNNNIPTYCNNFNSVIEPIIDIYVNDNQDDDDCDSQGDKQSPNANGNSRVSNNINGHYQMMSGSEIAATMGSNNNSSDNDEFFEDDDPMTNKSGGVDSGSDSLPVNNNNNNRSSSPLGMMKGRKITMPITSKTQFMQLIAENRQCNNLMREKVTKNMYALHTKDSDMVLGYQCSITGCSYMHFLRAQVNRHFKNYHSKTCSHCNQRFKRPIDLLIHMKEFQVPGVEMLQLQLDSSQQGL